MNVIKRTLQQIAAMCGGELNQDADGSLSVEGVSTDTRTIGAGNLFVPLAGDNFDGHDYAGDALARGAAAVLWNRSRELPAGFRQAILVEDTLDALQKLAGAYRQQLSVRVLGITGSNGKTSTKDMAASVLATFFKTHKTKGNYNNHIGLPLTLLEMGEDTEAAVIEMGMRGRGEIDLLTRIARPDAAIITNIGESHLLLLGSREEIARAKTEILAGMPEGGLFIYNGDEPLIEKVLPEMPQPGTIKKIRFGSGSDNDWYPETVTLLSGGARFRTNAADMPEFEIPLLGRHNVTNALAVIAVAVEWGIPAAKIAEGLLAAELTGMRIERVQARSGALVLNDAYNASPTSMRASLSLLQEMEGFDRRIAVLGDMLELGEGEAGFHREIGALLDPGRIDRVYAFGHLSRHLAEAAQMTFLHGRVHWFGDKDELIRALSEEIKAGDAVLVKASRGMRLEDAVRALQ